MRFKIAFSIALSLFFFLKTSAIEQVRSFSPDSCQDPWALELHTPKTQKTFTPLSKVELELIIAFHRQILSDADGPRSHYYPVSSHYMQDAIRTHGAFQGVLIGMERLLRENQDPWIYPRVEIGGFNLKYDPVKNYNSSPKCDARKDLLMRIYNKSFIITSQS